MKLLLNPEYGLYEKSGIVFCDSLQIAESFEKRHADVLRDINKHIESANRIGERKFALSNFLQDTYKTAQDKKQPKFLLTKSGFAKVAFGYEGDKANKFQIDYINRYEQMEAFIKSLQAAKLEFPAFTDAIMAAHDEPKSHHFSNEINMINRIVLGVDAKQFKIANGIDPKAPSIRPFLSSQQIQAIERLQRIDIGLQLVTPDYNERKRVLSEFHNKKLALVS